MDEVFETVKNEADYPERKTTPFSDDEVKELFSPDFSVLVHCSSGSKNPEKNIPVLISSLEEYKEGNWEVILLDNANSENLKNFEGRFGKNLRVIRKENRVGLCTLLNDGFSACRYPLVLVLEDDVEVTPGFIRPLLAAISEDEYFAVIPQIRLKTKKDMVYSLNLLHFRNGGIEVQEIPDGKFPDPVYVPNVSLTACLIRKDFALALGGFDPLLDPFFFADVDLGYRAWKRDQRIIYTRESIVYHSDEDPYTESFKGEEHLWMRFRNHHVFVEKNITDGNMYSQYSSKMFKTSAAIKLGFNKDPIIKKGLESIDKIKKELSEKRKIEKKQASIGDTELFMLFSSHPDNRLSIA
ncbi:MAG: glycosyltransferase [Firmicutes bacterium]|nr:glycosyltransferase [Bacillota bacterium]